MHTIYTHKSLEWRRQNRIDTIHEDFEIPEVYKKYFSAACVGQDKLLNQGEKEICTKLRIKQSKEFSFDCSLYS